MTLPKWPARTMSPCEAAWVAGIVDGEGTITIRTKPYPGGKRYQVASMSVPNTDVSMIARLVECTGIGRVGLNVRQSHKRKEIWRWQTDQRQAARVVEQLLPWLTAKRRVGELLLEFQTLRRCGKYRDGAAERQREIVAEVHGCNQRAVELEEVRSVVSRDRPRRPAAGCPRVRRELVARAEHQALAYRPRSG